MSNVIQLFKNTDMQHLLDEYMDLYYITMNEYELEAEGENTVYGRLESIETELSELLGEEECERKLNEIKEVVHCTA